MEGDECQRHGQIDELISQDNAYFKDRRMEGEVAITEEIPDKNEETKSNTLTLNGQFFGIAT